MNSLLKNAARVLCFVALPLGLLKSDQQELISRIANAERNMVVAWDGLVQERDLVRMGIGPNSRLHLVILTNGIDLPLEDSDEKGKMVAYEKRKHVFELAQRLGARHSFLNLSFLEAGDSLVVAERLAEKINEFFPTTVYFVHPRGKDVNLAYVRKGLGKNSDVRKHYAMPASALKRVMTANSGLEAWSVGLRYRLAQRKSIGSFDKFMRPVVQEFTNRAAPLEHKIRTAFVAVKWIEDAIKEDSSKVFRAYAGDKKWLFEELRSRWIGFDVECSLSDSALTAMEAVKLRLGSFHNAGDSLYAVLPSYKDKWAVNGRIWPSYYVHRNSTVAIFSPEEIEYTVQSDGNFTTEYFRYPYEIIFVRFDPRPEYNCLVRKTFYLDLTPKITIDYTPSILLTGIDQAIEFSLTSYSHDALADSIYLEDFIVESPRQYFRLAGKYAKTTLALKLNWKKSNPVKEKLAHPVLIGGIRIGTIPSDPLTVPEERGKLFLHSGLKKSSVRETLLRTRYIFSPYRPDSSPRTGDKIFIDRNSSMSTGQQEQLLEQVRGGATAICLLEGNSWLSKWAGGFGLDFRTENQFFYEVRADADTAVFRVSSSYFDNWLFHFTSYRVSGIRDSNVWIRDAHNDNPLIFSKEVGSGRVVFVNLALSNQLVNTNVNAMRLLFALCSTGVSEHDP